MMPYSISSTGGDRHAVLRTPQAIHVDGDIVDAEGIVEAALGQTADQRHLAALEARRLPPPERALGTLMTFAGSLAQTGANAAPKALRRRGRSWKAGLSSCSFMIRPSLVFDLLDLHHVLHLEDHAAHRGVVLLDDRLADLVQAQRAS